MEGELANQFGSGIIVAYFLEYLKHASWFSMIGEQSQTKLKILFGFLAALITTIGIHYTFDYDYNAGGVLQVTIPSVQTMAHSLWDLGKQWAFQQASYDGFVRKATNDPK